MTFRAFRITLLLVYFTTIGSSFAARKDLDQDDGELATGFGYELLIAKMEFLEQKVSLLEATVTDLKGKQTGICEELTSCSSFELVFVLIDRDLTRLHAHYDLFRIGNESEGFIIDQLGAYKGTAGDSFRYHAGMKFTTWDRKNDKIPGSSNNCAVTFHGAWWYNNCQTSNLNGRYRGDGESTAGIPTIRPATAARRHTFILPQGSSRSHWDRINTSSSPMNSMYCDPPQSAASVAPTGGHHRTRAGRHPADV
ncbi:fibrinogen and fibronectin [Culex quinquefasciatus]|uniref:Fibrinogen and fibronectin n=1 Tax=Culex quinquefasciatus TaxID=7176 RepID=B0XCE3_CULQU|nr:fibrinogen and fibronectin [Culex quinquefasciatus]|eukprot:XP_001867315.1 fibrinogen and fibronectin [Culex quinquefasciatus]